MEDSLRRARVVEYAEDWENAACGLLGREDVADIGGVCNQCWLAELSMRWRCGVGARMSSLSDWMLAAHNIRCIVCAVN